MTHWTDELVRWKACNDAVQWARAYPTMQAAWDACERADWMLWLMGRRGRRTGRRMRRKMDYHESKLRRAKP
jgi:hypothetical protein